MTEHRAPPPLEGPGFDAAWHALPRDDRRRITRAVRRGEVLGDPVDAAFAVRLARKELAPWRLWAFAVQTALLGVSFVARLHSDDAIAALPAWTSGMAVVASVLLLPWLLHQRRRTREAERRNLLSCRSGRDVWLWVSRRAERALSTRCDGPPRQ